MFNLHFCKTLYRLRGISRASPTPKSYRLLQLHPLISLLSLKYSTVTSDQHSFTVSYLINNFGFSPESALNASKNFRLATAENPDSVIAFFENHGFSNDQVNTVIRKSPKLLAFHANKTLLPKFKFLASKGASSSEIARLVTKNPRILHSSLENNIIPAYELVRSFFQSDRKVLDCVVDCPTFVASYRAARNVKMLLDYGVTNYNIHLLFRMRPSVILTEDLRKVVTEIKELGFDPSKSIFIVALLAKTTVSKPKWNAKVDAFKSWGWSEDDILDAFRKHPFCMLTSKDKINAVLCFWVHQLGLDSLALVKRPIFFGYSLEKRIMPRGFVVQYLLSKGLRDKNANLFVPFSISEKLFLEKYVICFKEETSQLLKLYQEKSNLEDNRDDCRVCS